MNKQYIDTDIMKIITSFCVVMIHVVTCVQSSSVLDKNLSVFINTICRFSVPVFVMISGRYMLENKFPIPHLIKKSLKLIFAMVFCAVVYTAHDMIVDDIEYTAQAFIIKILTSPIHLWYIYMICCLYLFTPLFSIFAVNATKKQCGFIICLCFFFGSILYIPLNTDGFYNLKLIIEKCKINCTLAFVGCYLSGNYLYRFKISNKERYLIYILGTISFFVSIFGAYSNYLNAETKNLMLSFFAPNVISQSIMFFYFIKIHSTNIAFAHKKINIIGQCTFGIYLWHVLVLKKIMAHIDFHINVVGVVLIALCTYITCLIIMIFYKALIKKGSKLIRFYNRRVI